MNFKNKQAETIVYLKSKSNQVSVITLRDWQYLHEVSEKSILHLRPMKIDVKFEYAPWKNVSLFPFPLFGFTLVIKLRKFDFENH